MTDDQMTGHLDFLVCLLSEFLKSLKAGSTVVGVICIYLYAARGLAQRQDKAVPAESVT